MPQTEQYVQGQLTTNIWDDIDADLRPEDWDTDVYEYTEFGDCPLTAIMDQQPSGTVRSIDVNWYEKPPWQGEGTITDVYTDAGSTAYASGQAAGTIVYLKVSASDANQAIVNNVWSVFHPTDPSKFFNIVIAAVDLTHPLGPFVIGKLTRTDAVNNVGSEASPKWMATGDSQAESSELPGGTNYVPKKYENQTEIIMAAAETSGTDLHELKQVDSVKFAEQVKEAYKRMRIRDERSKIFGSLYDDMINGKPRRFSRGLIEAIETYEPANILNYATATGSEAWVGDDWLDGGMDFIDYINEEGAKYSTAQGKEWFVGNAAFTALNKLFREHGYTEIRTDQSRFGFRITTVVGFHQDMRLIRHPLMSRGILKNSAIVLETGLLSTPVLEGRGLTFVPGDKSSDGYSFVDGKKVGWYKESTLKWNNLASAYVLHGIGIDNNET